MKKAHKREIREDEFRSGLEHTIAWAQGHQREVLLSLAVFVVVAAGSWGFRAWQDKRAADASAAFAEALDAYLTPVADEMPEGAGTTAKAFATKAEKLSKAIAAFDGVERRFPSTAAAGRARYFAAVTRIEAGDTAQAEPVLKELAGDGQTLEAGLARLALADLYRRTGDTDKAVEVLRQVVATPESAVPRDAALMNLAEIQEQARRLEEARGSYERLVVEFPTSVYATEARTRSEFLETLG